MTKLTRPTDGFRGSPFRVPPPDTLPPALVAELADDLESVIALQEVEGAARDRIRESKERAASVEEEFVRKATEAITAGTSKAPASAKIVTDARSAIVAAELDAEASTRACAQAERALLARLKSDERLDVVAGQECERRLGRVHDAVAELAEAMGSLGQAAAARAWVASPFGASLRTADAGVASAAGQITEAIALGAWEQAVEPVHQDAGDVELGPEPQPVA